MMPGRGPTIVQRSDLGWVEKTGVSGHRRGELGGNRTHDPRIKSALLYRLSYELISISKYHNGRTRLDAATCSAQPRGLLPADKVRSPQGASNCPVASRPIAGYVKEARREWHA